MPNWTDNVLTVTGPAGVLDTFVEEVSGENGLIDFSSHLPEPVVNEHGDPPSWWECNAVAARLVDREPEQLVVVFRTAWEPPLDWANALEGSYPELQLSLLFGDEFGQWAGLWFANEDRVDEEWVESDKAGYPAVWRFVHDRGWDFGWDDPAELDPLRGLPALKSIMINEPYSGPERLVAGGRTWSQRQVGQHRAGVTAFFELMSDHKPDLIEQLTGLPAAQLKFELSNDHDAALARLAALDEDIRVRLWEDSTVRKVFFADGQLFLEQAAAFWKPHGTSQDMGWYEDRAAS